MARIIRQNKIEAIDYTETVRVTKMGNIIEVQQSTIRGKGGKIKKISKEEYIDTETGEKVHWIGWMKLRIFVPLR